MCRRVTIAAVLLALSVAVAAACGGAKKPAATPPGVGQTETPAPPSSPTAPAPETITPAASEPTPAMPPGSPLAEFHGVPFYELKPAAAAALPAGGVLYFTETCATCEGGALFRARQAADGNWMREPLLATTPAGIVEGAAIGPFASDGVAQFAVLWCRAASGPCGKTHGGPTNNDPRSLLYSEDRAVTWKEIALVPPGSFILGFRGHEVLTGFPDGTYALYPSGNSIPRPLTGSFVIADAPPGWQAVETGDTEFGLRLANDSSSVIGVFPVGGRLASYFAFPGGNLQLTGWLSPTLLMGAADRGEKAMLIGSDELLGGFDRLPVLIDLEARSVAPIAGLVPSSQFAWLRPIVFRPGPLLQVASVDACLHVRESPSTSARSLGCFRDGVLLGDRGETREAHGLTWVAVTTPAGEPGWAAAQFLER